MTTLPLVLVPGLLCDARLWRPQVEALADIAECWVADTSRSDSMAGLAADLLADAPFHEFSLAGLSMGGYIAFEVLRQAKERVRGLALLDTSARPDPPEQQQRRRDLIELAGRGRFLGVTDALLPFLIHTSRLGDAPLVATIKDMARSVGKEAFVRQERAIMGRPDSRPLLPHIQCPTLVLCGADDAVTPVDRHEEMASAIPPAALSVVEHCGHLSTLEQPERVSVALRGWLQRV
jgi:pimeloyl-ACP methyl ester carboxylesterase